MKEAIIHGIFPTPVYKNILNRKLTKKELDFVKKSKKDFYRNEGNITSNNSYILNTKEFSKLKKDLDKFVKDYVDKVMALTDSVQPYITQSWLNYTETNQFHHRHAHPNSLISGVFYIDCKENVDKIKFFRDEYKIIKPEIKEWNFWNSESWWFSVKTGDIILFPSSLIHMVENKEGTNTRISLAFNVFLKGKIGNQRSLAELVL